MGEIKVRNIPEAGLVWLRGLAGQKGVSVEEYIRQLVSGARREARRALFGKMKRRLEAMRKKSGVIPDSTPLIRQMRQQREAELALRRGRKRSG